MTQSCAFTDAAVLRRADQTVAPELLKRPVDMHRGHAGGVAELGLRNRHLEGLSVYQADGPEAHIDLAQDVRDPGVGIAAADIDHPLPKHRRIDERVPPEHIGDARVCTKEGTNHLMGDEGRSKKKWRKRRAGARSWRPNCSARPITTLRHAA